MRGNSHETIALSALSIVGVFVAIIIIAHAQTTTTSCTNFSGQPLSCVTTIPPPSGNGYYFSQSSGNDSNSCTSSSSACRTISKLNSLSYPSGSTIYLKAGDTWNAGTTLTLSTSHVTGSLTVTTYGGGTCNVIARTTSGCATLQASGSQANGATITGLSNFTIENIRFLGGTGSTITNCTTAGNCPSGVAYTNGGSSTSNITIQNVEAEDFDYDILINGGVSTLSSNVSILDNYAHGSSSTSQDMIGIFAGAFENSTIQGNLVTNIGGNSSGYPCIGCMASGIFMGGNSNTNITIQYNVSHDNGANYSGGSAIWNAGGSNYTYQFNEAYNQLAGGGYDGDGFDFDCGTTSSIMQFNYSHNNWGVGYLMWAGGTSAYCGSVWQNNQMRYNISEGDYYGWSGGGRGSFDVEVGGSLGTTAFYNNTIYTHATSGSTSNGMCFGTTANSNVLVYNNICYNDSDNPFINTIATFGTLDYNDYYRTGPTPTDPWTYGGTNYTSFSAWQGAGNDTHGMTANPSLTSPGGGSTCYTSGDATGGPQPCPSAYKLTTGSAMIGIGKDLSSTFTLPSRDYYGNSIPNGVGTGYNIGADGGNP
jgi:hypothetical protein